MDTEKLNTLVVITGPTASGKTALSVEVARKLNTEIVSADSRQFYREMTIGTAKPSPDELQSVPHHFINSLSIHDEYNVGKYETEAIACIQNLFQHKKVVVLTGGSGLYIQAVCKGFDAVPAGDSATRKELTLLLKTNGIEHLQQLLKEKDPTYYNEVDLQNPQRIIRALEVCLSTGLPYSSFRQQQFKQRPFNIINIGLEVEREALYERINKRVDEMITAGLEGEARQLYPYKHLNPLQTVGYRELFDYFNGHINFDEAVELIKRNTRHFAKRQMTWFRKDTTLIWLNPLQILDYLTKTLESKQP